MKIKLGTRGSRLALKQAQTVSQLMESTWEGVQVEVVVIKTSGDHGNRDQLGAFVHEIELAVKDQTIDLGLHCLKDLPIKPDEADGVSIAAYLSRDEWADCLISRFSTFEELPHGATVGTGSLRRTSQLLSFRPDLQFKRLIGNIDTRLKKLQSGEYDAIILAEAGISRMGGLHELIQDDHLRANPIPASILVPCAGQGTLVLQGNRANPTAFKLCFELNDRHSAAAAIAERTFLRRFGTGCSLPVGALAEVSGSEISFHGRVVSPDGKRRVDVKSSGALSDAAAVGHQAAEEAIIKGALELIPEEVPAQ